MPSSLASHQQLIAMNSAVTAIAVHACQLRRAGAGGGLAVRDPPGRAQARRVVVPRDMGAV
jgi:hypothetical protein